MNEHNPYVAPDAAVSDLQYGEQQLADRGPRLAAAIIDGLILLVIMIPLMFFGGYFSAAMAGEQPGFGTTLMWALLGFVVFVVVQGVPLKASGQTWGKKALKMKIVDLEGRTPEFGRLLALRYLTTQLITQIPLVGWLYGLVNVLFIFGEDRRCLHDRIAGTRVVHSS